MSRLRELLRFDRSLLAPTTALTSAVGYAVPLVIGLATNHLTDGVAASAGALIVGFANFGGRVPVRIGLLLVTTATAGIAALIGGLAGPSDVATVVVITLFGFATGLLVAFGTQAAFVGMLATWTLLQAGDLNLHGAAVLQEAWLVLAGGLVQLVVVAATWPFRPYAPERRSVADAFAALARCARSPDAETLQACAGRLQDAARTVGGLAPTSGERRSLRGLVEQGEWIRIEIAALARYDARAVLDAGADVLDGLAAGGATDPPLEVLQTRVADLHDPEVRQRAEALARWITAAAHGDSTEVPLRATPQRPLTALRAEMRLQSTTLHHALRLGAALAVATALYRGLALGSGYWVPLAVLFVLKPDYGTTVSRALGRAVGTAVGVTIAWLIVTPFVPSDPVVVVLLAVLAYGAYAVFSASYALYSVLLAVLVALLAQYSGGSPVGALGDRLLDTAIGTAVALVAVTVWPTREATRTFEVLAAFVDTEGRWVDAALASYDGGDRELTRSARLDTRPARAQAYDAVRRALGDTRRRRPDDRPLRAVLVAMDDISASTLALVAAERDGARLPAAEVAAMRAAVARRFDDVATVLRHRAATPLGERAGERVPERAPERAPEQAPEQDDAPDVSSNDDVVLITGTLDRLGRVLGEPPAADDRSR